MPLHRGTSQTRLVILVLLLLCDSIPTLLSTLLTLRYFTLLFRCWLPKIHRCRLLWWPRRWRRTRTIQRCSVLPLCRDFTFLTSFNLPGCVYVGIKPVIEHRHLDISG